MPIVQDSLPSSGQRSRALVIISFRDELPPLQRPALTKGMVPSGKDAGQGVRDVALPISAQRGICI